MQNNIQRQRMRKHENNWYYFDINLLWKPRKKVFNNRHLRHFKVACTCEILLWFLCFDLIYLHKASFTSYWQNTLFFCGKIQVSHKGVFCRACRTPPLENQQTKRHNRIHSIKHAWRLSLMQRAATLWLRSLSIGRASYCLTSNAALKRREENWGRGRMRCQIFFIEHFWPLFSFAENRWSAAAPTFGWQWWRK